MNIEKFKTMVWDFYHTTGRSFAWRQTKDPYRIVVSEVMLQQTQTYRVAPKFEQFLEAFFDFESLAQAQLREVLGLWQGLGYNRRAKFLHQLAQAIMNDHGGQLPDDPELLVKLPGIGPATAASITAFAFNKPTIFIETNIRAVYLDSFFSGQSNIHDKQLMPLIAKTVCKSNPREWYYALMDYGVMLKATRPNPSRASRHHAKQSKFEGSDRQIRGALIRALTQVQFLDRLQIENMGLAQKDRLDRIIEDLVAEKLVQKVGKKYLI